MQASLLLSTSLFKEDATLVEMLMPLLVIGILVFVSFKGLREWVARIRGHYFRRNYVVIIGLSRIAMQLAGQLLAQGRKVSVLSPGKLSSEAEILRKKGAHVLANLENESSMLEKAGLRHARCCLIVGENDKENLGVAELIRELKRKQTSRRRLRILVQVKNISTVEVMKDYLLPASLQGNSELIPFNEKRMAAQQVYDLNPPYAFLNGEARLENKECICVLGFNPVAELFLVENAILSQYPGKRKLKIILLTAHADMSMKGLFIRRPFLADYLDLVPFELVNTTFAPSSQWNPELIRLLPEIDAVYCFNEDDSEQFLQAMHFRQFLYQHTQQARRVPFTLCLPEATNIGHLLNPEGASRSGIPTVRDLNLHIFHQIRDTCTVRNLIDENDISQQLAIAVNYCYSVRYEFSGILRDEFRQPNAYNVLKEIDGKLLAFRPTTSNPLAEMEKLVLDMLVAFTKNSVWRLRKHFGIMERWNLLTERKKDSNRYVVRHIGHKVHILERSGAKDISRETVEKQMHILAPLEHKRWSAEKYAAGFASGKLPDDDKTLRAMLKDVMKVHDKLIDFEKLDEENKHKDLDLFLILPMLLAIRKQLTLP